MWGILSIYINQKSEPIFKYTRLDNGLMIGDYNSFGHKLVFKGYIKNNVIVKCESLINEEGENENE